MKSLLIFAAIFAVLACGAATDSTQPIVQSASLVGTWKVKTINGAPPPFAVFVDGPDTTYIVNVVFTFTSGGQVTELDSAASADGRTRVYAAQTFQGTYQQINGLVSIYEPATGEAVNLTASDGVLRASASYYIGGANQNYVWVKE